MCYNLNIFDENKQKQLFYNNFESQKRLVTMKTKTNDPQYVKHYCCLYHFTTGKKQKSSTPCYNHVPLGVINPIHTTVPRSPRKQPSDLKISSKPHEINFHTHDLNQIENKQSLPKRLAYPRVYVEQIHPKNHNQNCNIIAGHEAFLKKKEFQDIFLMFKRYAKLTTLKTQEETLKHIHKFSKSRNIQLDDDEQGVSQYLYQHNEFINYLISIGFDDVQAEQFWEIAFNRCRFSISSLKIPSKNRKQVISMRAFAYNFKKFYLEELESYKNCLSQSALRQRMIDLRLFLQPWFNRNIIFKENHQQWKQIQLEICTQLKRYGQDKLYSTMIASIELRNKIWLFMRTLAKIYYIVTDQKNIGLEIFNQRATDIINKNKVNLEAFSDFLNHFETFLIENNRAKDEKFKITNLLEFSKQKYPQTTSSIVVYLRGLFKYLYFFKNCTLLKVNKSTLNLDCSAIAEVTYNELMEFLSFKQKETNHLMDMISAICQEINEIVDARPDVNGHKKFLNQCNYVAESLLKMIKRCDLMVFYRLQQARQLYLEGNITDSAKLKQIFDQKNMKNDEITMNFWKKIFQFIQQPKPQVSVTTQKDENFEKNYKVALDSYQELRKKLQGKLPNCDQKRIKSSNNEGQYINAQKPKKSGSRKSKKSEKEFMEANESSQPSPPTNNIKHKCYNSNYCSLCDDICSTSVTQSLTNIDSMSNYLMDLLKDI